jgi:drug/metabolite transporter (DMT)-like permease
MNDVKTQQATRATLMLVCVTMLWGLSFPWMKTWQDASQGCPGGPLLAGLTHIALRMPLAALVLALWQPKVFTAPSRREHGAGALLGVVFSSGLFLQVWGLAWASPALSAFFTSLACVWAPLMAWAFLGHSLSSLVVLGLGVGLTGTAVLGVNFDSAWGLGTGEALTLLASILFALQILLLDHLGRRVEPAHLTAGFLGITGAAAALIAWVLALSGPGLLAWMAWTWTMLRDPVLLANLGALTLLSTVLAFHWMNIYQPRIPASRAALIYLLEPVFGALFSLWTGQDTLTARLVGGGSLILLGNLLVEAPRWFRAAPGAGMAA